MTLAILSRLTLAAASVALAGCSLFGPKPPEPDPVPTFEPRAELRSLWQVGVGSSGTYRFQPAVVSGAVYATGGDGSVVRVEAASGRTQWRRDVGDALSAGVGSDGRTVAVVTVGGEVVALDAASGEERWRASVGAEVLAAPGVSEQVVVVRTSGNRVLAFETADGARRWTYEREMPALTLRNAVGMAVDERAAIVGYPGGKLVSINLENGGPLWEITVSTPRGVTELERVTDVAGIPVVSGDEVCAVTYQGRAGCFDITNGRVIWTVEFSSASGLDRDGPLVFVSSARDAVHALDASDGTNVWTQGPLALRRLSRPLAVGDGVVFGDFEGYVHALDRSNGGIIARTRVSGGAIEAAPVALDGARFVVQTTGGGVEAFELVGAGRSE
ncbi:MAG: outer membrane protein assembly factor BamB [Azoarcus sp.]|nr:outer membrane protein assembly factor BamB [Azoarcus sp.]